MDDVIVRVAVARDLEAITRIQAASGRPAHSVDAVATALADRSRLVVVAVRAGDVVGWAKTHHWSTPSGAAPAGHYLGGVTVDPSERHHGIGSTLTAARLDWIRERESVAYFVTNAQNQASIAMHASFGFAEIARADHFHTTTFTTGEGILFRAEL